MRGAYLFLALRTFHKGKGYSRSVPSFRNLLDDAVEMEDVFAVELYAGRSSETIGVANGTVGINVLT